MFQAFNWRHDKGCFETGTYRSEDFCSNILSSSQSHGCDLQVLQEELKDVLGRESILRSERLARIVDWNRFGQLVVGYDVFQLRDRSTKNIKVDRSLTAR